MSGIGGTQNNIEEPYVDGDGVAYLPINNAIIFMVEAKLRVIIRREGIK